MIARARKSERSIQITMNLSRDSTTISDGACLDACLDHARALRRGNRRYFPCAADMSPSLVQEWDYEAHEGARRVKNHEMSRTKLVRGSIFPKTLPSFELSIRSTGGFAWSFVREDGPRCPTRRAVIEGSFQGVRLETLKPSHLFLPPPLP